MTTDTLSTRSKNKNSSEAKVPNLWIEPLADAPATVNDTEIIIRRYVEYKRACSDHINSFNEILDSGLKDVFERTYKFAQRLIPYESKKAKGSDIETIKIEPKYSNIVVHAPRMIVRETGARLPMTPAFALMNSRYYVAWFTGDFTVTLTATKRDGTKITRSDTINNVEITSLPIVERSNRCPLSTMSHEMQLASCEDPLNPGGFYTLGGSEWVVNHVEALPFNQLRCFNTGHEGTVTRAEMLSKLDNTNGNSAQLIIMLMESDELVIVIDHAPFRNFVFPFYALFRLLGAETHKEIMDSIVYEYDSPISLYMQTRMMRCFEAKYKQFGDSHKQLLLDDLRTYIINRMGLEFNPAGKDIFEKNKNVWYTDLYKHIDLWLLPHLGQDEGDRQAKWRALGSYIRYLWMVESGVYPETSRDSEVSKRNERSGQRMIKMLKTYINSTIARPLMDAYAHALQNQTFETVNLKEIHNNACDSDQLKKIIIKLITGGAKGKAIKTGQRGRTIANRLNTQQLTPHTYLNTYSMLHQIVSDPTTASSKASVREHEMRQVQPTSFGFKCPIQTQESENIGRNKEMTITCNLTAPSNITVLLDTLTQEYKQTEADIDEPLIWQDPPLADRAKMTQVSINWSGIIVGWTRYPALLTDKYRWLRRQGELESTVSIVWDIRRAMVIFYCDGDRMVRPMCIVYNNYGGEYTRRFCKNAGDLSDFAQWSAVRKSHIADLVAGTLTVQDMISLGLIELIDAEEQDRNGLIAYSPEFLERERGNHRVRYTHMEMPASLYGLPALVGNNFNLNMGVRTAYASNHCRQAAGEHASNWRWRKDKGISLQTYCELSPIYTIANSLTISTGCMFRVDVDLDRYNQEDSQTMCGLINESGKLTTEFLEKISNVLGNDEEFRVPTLAESVRKINADFSQIDQATCMPKPGTMLRRGSVVIPKVHKTTNKEGEVVYEDRSSIYLGMEPGLVIKVTEFRDEDDVVRREVFIVKTRNPVLGDKFSSKHGQKGVVGAIKRPNDMAFEEDGSVADLVINTHCFPTRLTTAQWTESAFTVFLALMCALADATVHNPVSIPHISELLESIGLRGDGTVQLYNGATGMPKKTRVFRGMVFYQNVQKNTKDKRYVVESGSTDIITRGPLEGKGVDGGLRIGEMERDVLLAIGVTLFTAEKFYYHSNNATIYICENCGTVPTVNVKSSIECRLCGDGAQVYAVATTWASWVFLEELRTLNIKIRLQLESHIYYKSPERSGPAPAGGLEWHPATEPAGGTESAVANVNFDELL